jgi:hypothetical protein
MELHGPPSRITPIELRQAVVLGTIFNDAGYWQGEFLSLGSPGPSVGHWGEYDGYTTAAFWFPEKRTAIVSIVNAGQTPTASSTRG